MGRPVVGAVRRLDPLPLDRGRADRGYHRPHVAHDPAEPVVLTSTRTEFEANVIAEALRAQGIESRVVSVVGAVLGAYVPGMQDAIQVLVRAEDAQRARDALAATRSDSVDIAWDELDVGETADPLAARRPIGVRRWMRGSTIALLLFVMSAICVMFAFTPIPIAVVVAALFVSLVARMMAKETKA